MLYQVISRSPAAIDEKADHIALSRMLTMAIPGVEILAVNSLVHTSQYVLMYSPDKMASTSMVQDMEV